MKKILSLALAVVMLFTMSVTVFAQTITDSGSVDVTYTSQITYTITIPDSMIIGQDATVSVSDVVIGADQGLTITVSSSQYNDGWQLTDGKNNIGYTLKNKATYEDITNNGTVLYTTAGTNADVTLATAIKQSPIYSGTFTDTLTFSVQLVERNITQAEAEALVEQARTLCNTIENDSNLTNQFSSDKDVLKTEWNNLNQMITSYFINQETNYTQKDINRWYSKTLTSYNTLQAKVSAAS